MVLHEVNSSIASSNLGPQWFSRVVTPPPSKGSDCPLSLLSFTPALCDEPAQQHVAQILLVGGSSTRRFFLLYYYSVCHRRLRYPQALGRRAQTETSWRAPIRPWALVLTQVSMFYAAPCAEPSPAQTAVRSRFPAQFPARAVCAWCDRSQPG